MTKDSRILACFATLALTAGACSTADGANWAGTIRDSAGIQIVENPATGLWSGDRAWRLVEDLRIGTAEGEPEYQFGALAAIEVADDGTIYVLDQQGQHIKVFDSQGQYLRTIGRPGSGLGELSPGVVAGGLVLTRGDTLLVLDQGNARYVKFLTDGTGVGSFRIDFARTGFPFRIDSDADGNLIAQMRRFALPGTTADSMDRVVRLSGEGEPLDTLMSVPSGQTFQFVNGQPQWQFFSPEPLWAVLPTGGLLYGVNSNYRIELRDTTGQVTQIITKHFTAQPVTEDHANRMRDAVIEIAVRQAGRPLPPQALQMMRANMNFAANYPVMGFVTPGPDGSTWVQLVRSVADLNEGELENFNIQMDLAAPRWDVFDSQGRYLGRVEMPGRIQVLAIDGDVFYGVMRDELDVQYVVRLRLARPAA
ncbi:MAG: 6-bladed beta-propeller [Gemmatimonadales bacterium]